jgi:hypothetical protein
VDDYRDPKYDGLIGRTVKAVEFGASNLFGGTDGYVSLYLDDGSLAMFGLDGDCCSTSTFEDKRQFLELNGAKIQGVEERSNADRNLSPEGNGGETDWSFLVFITSVGHVTIDWRNDSNGYYGGYVLFDLRKGSKA